MLKISPLKLLVHYPGGNELNIMTYWNGWPIKIWDVIWHHQATIDKIHIIWLLGWSLNLAYMFMGICWPHFLFQCTAQWYVYEFDKMFLHCSSRFHDHSFHARMVMKHFCTYTMMINSSTATNVWIINEDALHQQSGTKPNLVANIWPPNLVAICTWLPKLVANVSSPLG